MKIRPLLFNFGVTMKTYRWGVFMAIVVGCVVIAPQFVFIQSLGSAYQGLYLMNTDAETHYIARMQEVYDGNGTGNPYVHEYKDLPSPLFTYSEAILAYPGIILGIPATTMNLVYKFILPMLIALLVYGFIFRLTLNRLQSIAGVALLMLGYSLINMPDILHFIRLDVYYTDLLMYSRPVNPQFSTILFFAYLHVMLSVFRDAGENGIFKRSYYILLGLITGLAFYSYFYSFTFFIALNAVCILYFILTRNIKKMWGVLVSSLIGCVIGVFFIIHMVMIMQHPYYEALADILGVQASHAPIISFAGLITLFVFLLYYWKSAKAPADNFILVLLITSFVVVNQQIITGIVVQTGHYHWYFNSPIYLMTLVYVASQLLRGRSRALQVMFAIAVILVSVGDATYIQYSAYRSARAQTVEKQRYVVVFDWLRQHTPPESVVFANDELSELIPVFTSNNVVWHAPAGFYLLPPERRLFDQEHVIASGFDLSAYGAYRLDYLIWDTKKNPDWHIDANPGYEFVDRVGDFEVFSSPQ